MNRIFWGIIFSISLMFSAGSVYAGKCNFTLDKTKVIIPCDRDDQSCVKNFSPRVNFQAGEDGVKCTSFVYQVSNEISSPPLKRVAACQVGCKKRDDLDFSVEYDTLQGVLDNDFGDFGIAAPLSTNAVIGNKVALRQKRVSAGFGNLGNDGRKRWKGTVKVRFIYKCEYLPPENSLEPCVGFANEEITLIFVGFRLAPDTCGISLDVDELHLTIENGGDAARESFDFTIKNGNDEPCQGHRLVAEQINGGWKGSYGSLEHESHGASVIPYQLCGQWIQNTNENELVSSDEVAAKTEFSCDFQTQPGNYVAGDHEATVRLTVEEEL